MKLQKKGFTIVEILIVLAVIGIIAAIVMPQFVKNINKSKTGVVLGRAVEQIELGCQNMIQFANDSKSSSYADRLTGVAQKDLDPAGNNDSITDDEDIFTSRLAPFIGVQRLDNVNSVAFNHFTGPSVIGLEQIKAYEFTKVPGRVYIQKKQNIENKPDEIVATFYIDVNGEVNPNRFGRDVFEFGLQNSCKMVPYGLEDDDLYSNNCKDDNITDGRACAARVVTDGYKVNYIK